MTGSTDPERTGRAGRGRRLRIALLEPYDTPSHRSLAAGLVAGSRHEVVPLTLPPRAWKWRMRTAALHYAPRLVASGPWDLLLASDYVNLGELHGLLPEGLRALPAVLYLHENQLTYPLQPGERRDHHFALTHLYAMLAARAVLFNSAYHRDALLGALRGLLAHVPDVDCGPALAAVADRARVLPLGTDAPRGHPRGPGTGPPTLVWNHRLEYDKDPLAFLDALLVLAERGIEFRAVLLGPRFRARPDGVDERLAALGDRVREAGFLERPAYLRTLAEAQVVCSTARHEFFGVGTLEALRSGLWPVLPDDLAYPELLPADLDERGRFLRRRAPGALVAGLAAALEGVRAGAALADRERIVAHTDGFAWPRLAPRFDAELERAAGLTNSDGASPPAPG